LQSDVEGAVSFGSLLARFLSGAGAMYSWCLILSRVLFFGLVVFCLLQGGSPPGPSRAHAKGLMAAEPTYSPEDVKAAFLLNFGRFIEWPVEVFVRSPRQFNLCVIGPAHIVERTTQVLQNETIKERKVAVVKRSPTEALADCQIVYITLDGNSAQVSGILLRLKAAAILSVSDHAEFIKLGGIIQFKLQAQRVGFKIYLTAAERAGLKISSKLLNVAEVIR